MGVQQSGGYERVTREYVFEDAQGTDYKFFYKYQKDSLKTLLITFQKHCKSVKINKRYIFALLFFRNIITKTQARFLYYDILCFNN